MENEPKNAKKVLVIEIILCIIICIYVLLSTKDGKEFVNISEEIIESIGSNIISNIKY